MAVTELKRTHGMSQIRESTTRVTKKSELLIVGTETERQKDKETGRTRQRERDSL